MKDILSKLNESIHNESKGSAFENEVKYSKSDWEKWKKDSIKDLFVGNYENEPDLELVYIPNHKTRMMDHIATYNKKTETLFCDDINLFGNEVSENN